MVDFDLLKLPFVPRARMMMLGGYGPQARAMMMVTVLNGLGGSFFWFLFTLYLGEMMYSPGAIGIILMVMGFTSTLPLMPAGYLGDRFGRKRMIVIGLALSTLAPVIVIFASDFVMLSIGSVIHGLGQSFYGPGFLALLAEKVNDRERKYLFSMQSFVGMISGAITILIAGFTPGALAALFETSLVEGYRMSFVIAVIGYILEFPIILSLKETGKDGYTTGTIWGRILGNGKGRAVATGRAPPPIPWRTIASLCLPMALIGIGAGLIVPFFQLYFVWRFDTSLEVLGILFSVTQFFWGLAYLVMPYVSDRMGSVRAITTVQFIAILALVGIPISPSFHFVAMMYTIRMVVMNSTWPILQSYCIGQVPEEHSSLTLSATNFSFNVPKGLTPGIAGYIYQYNLDLPFFICAFFYTLSTTVFFLVFKDKDDRCTSLDPACDEKGSTRRRKPPRSEEE